MRPMLADGDKLQGGYRRGNLFDKRRATLDAWARCCVLQATRGKVVAIGR